MLNSRALRVLFSVALLVPLAGCSKEKESPPDARAEVIDPKAEFSVLRFADGQISLNDRCPVRKAKLNPRMVPVYVNGRPIGFC